MGTDYALLYVTGPEQRGVHDRDDRSLGLAGAVAGALRPHDGSAPRLQ